MDIKTVPDSHMEYLYFHALEFVKVNNRLTERNVLEIVLMFGAKMGDLLSVFAVAPHAGAWVEIICGSK